MFPVVCLAVCAWPSALVSSGFMGFSPGKSWALEPWEGQILHGGRAPCMASAGLLRKQFVRALNLGPIAGRSCVFHLLKPAGGDPELRVLLGHQVCHKGGPPGPGAPTGL